jgi:hypothetical protein
MSVKGERPEDIVTPAQAGVQGVPRRGSLDSRFRGNDVFSTGRAMSAKGVE